jgi:hypothetical protein
MKTVRSILVTAIAALGLAACPRGPFPQKQLSNFLRGRPGLDKAPGCFTLSSRPPSLIDSEASKVVTATTCPGTGPSRPL